MKRRYLFPLVYIALDACLWLFASVRVPIIDFPLIPILISGLSIPSGFVMQFVTRTFGFPTDPAVFSYFVGLGTILQMYLLGLLWELLVSGVQRLVSRRRSAVQSMP